MRPVLRGRAGAGLIRGRLPGRRDADGDGGAVEPAVAGAGPGLDEALAVAARGGRRGRPGCRRTAPRGAGALSATVGPGQPATAELGRRSSSRGLGAGSLRSSGSCCGCRCSEPGHLGASKADRTEPRQARGPASRVAAGAADGGRAAPESVLATPPCSLAAACRRRSWSPSRRRSTPRLAAATPPTPTTMTAAAAAATRGAHRRRRGTTTAGASSSGSRPLGHQPGERLVEPGGHVGRASPRRRGLDRGRRAGHGCVRPARGPARARGSCSSVMPAHLLRWLVRGRGRAVGIARRRPAPGWVSWVGRIGRRSLVPGGARSASSTASRARPRAHRLFTVPVGTSRIAAASATG